MRLKVWLVALFLGGMLVGTAAADPNDKPLKNAEKAARKAERNAEGNARKAERNAQSKAIAVPEPSALLLASLGMGVVLVGGWFVRRRHA